MGPIIVTVSAKEGRGKDDKINNKNRRSFCGLKPTVFDPSIFGIENCLTKVRGIKPTIFNNYKYYEFKNQNVDIKIIIGDATKTIKKIDKSFDAVFLDPFSPPKNPELWTLEFFKEVKDRMNLTAKLATYSCAGVVRRNLAKAGFEVIDGPCIGRKSPSLVAINA